MPLGRLTPPELGSIRLVSWSYVLLQEHGGADVAFLVGKAEALYGDARPRAAWDAVRDIRTWLHHSLREERDGDRRRLLRVRQWMRDVCGHEEPSDDAAWNAVFERIANDMSACLEGLEKVVREVCGDQELLDEWLEHVEVNPPDEDLDDRIRGAARRLGVSVSASALRQQRGASWRERLRACPDASQRSHVLTEAVEAALLDVTPLLPITGADIIGELGVAEGPRVGSVLRRARELQSETRRERDDLLTTLREEISGGRL